MQSYLPACKIVSTHGVRGEMKALPLCDGAEFWPSSSDWYATADGTGECRVLGVRPQGNVILLRLADVTDMDAARAQVGSTYYFAKADARLPKGRYFIDDLLGCEVRDADTGAVYGILTEVTTPRPGHLHRHRCCRREAHAAAVPEFVKTIDIDARTILVTPIDGMFNDAVNGDKE